MNNLEKEALGFSILIGILLLFILYVYIQSWRSFRNKEDNRFNENLYQYRKTLYFLFVLCLGILWIVQILSIKDWQTLLILAVIVVFIDISVFSTPTIKKIWRTEFQAFDPLKSYIQENSLLEERQKDKLNYFSQLIQIAPLIKSDIDSRDLEFSEALSIFLSYYAEAFGLRIHLYQVEANRQNEEQPYETIDLFIETIQIIKHTHTLDWSTMPDNLVKPDETASSETIVIETLWNGDIVALDREEKHGKGMAHLCPVFVGEDEIFLLFIEEHHQRVYEMDALFLTNLACLFCFFEKQNE